MEKNNNFEQDEIAIDLGELFQVFWNKAHMIILAGVVLALAAFAWTKIFITPQYDSTTKIFVITKQNENTVTSSDLQTGTLLTKDYMEMVKSRLVLEEVIAVLNLDMTTEQLAQTITVETPAETRLINITVRNEDPKLAKSIADAVREAASIQIQEVMNIDAVNTVEEANLPTQKAAPNTMKNTLLGGILGVFIAIGIIVIIYILDDTIKTPDDVERYLELNVLASLPIKEGTKKNKKAKNIARKAAMQAKKKRR